MSQGRMCDVIIEESWRYANRSDLAAGLKTFFALEVWADPGLEKIIEEVEGVLSVFYIYGYYHVHLDKRYDLEFLKQEIEAQIKIKGKI